MHIISKIHSLQASSVLSASPDQIQPTSCHSDHTITQQPFMQSRSNKLQITSIFTPHDVLYIHSNNNFTQLSKPVHLSVPMQTFINKCSNFINFPPPTCGTFPSNKPDFNDPHSFGVPRQNNKTLLYRSMLGRCAVPPLQYCLSPETAGEGLSPYRGGSYTADNR